MNTTLIQNHNEPARGLHEPHTASASAGQPRASFRAEGASNYQAWIACGPKQPMALEVVDLGPLNTEDVEVAVEHCGLRHSDLSVLKNESGISQFPAILDHEVVGRVTAVGPNNSYFGRRASSFHRPISKCVLTSEV